MIDLDEIFLNILKIFLIELKVILLYCINRITQGPYIFKLNYKNVYSFLRFLCTILAKRTNLNENIKYI